ncbi:LuxR family transcriptional regulator [Mycolicibacterium sp. P9-22]|uniref:helix-turn-helix transcriptional regulator n=1 Tax=Mycolicibacterium sp. P9-22 TaxID=2024613 RepID=UPI0011ECA7AC|nr:LuxR family transcriptional regulator [Mycolicibacterium sp. P9-22]KAA0114417.1 LuxR family transcriptional regulator [Mycolicibacterium sp. P9-22]
MIRDWPLLGRAEELRVITDATRGDGHRTRGIVLTGAAGVGKTSLARAAVAACGRPPEHIRWITGTASARDVPLAAFADIAVDFGPDPLRRSREVIDTLVGDSTGNDVILGVDDAHLLDDLSAFTVHQLVTRRLATVILTVRSRERPPDAIAAIWQQKHLECLELQPLSLPEMTALVEQVLAGPVHSRCAQQLWQFTQGNVLYLRHLLDSEIGAGRLHLNSGAGGGVWLWDGQPQLSPTLTELIESRIASTTQPVREVVDALAVTEPLDIAILTTVTSADAVAQAHALGLLRLDTADGPARLAHPMLGEVRRTNSLRMRRLRGRIAAALATTKSTDPRDLVRRAVLTADSDLPADPTLFGAATWAAMQLLDLRLAETLAQRAEASGSGIQAKIAQVMALTWQERGHDAERVLAELAEQAPGPLRAHVAMLRALNFAGILGQIARAERELDEFMAADDADTQVLAAAVRALIEAARGHAAAAADRAADILTATPDSNLARMLATFALISALRDLGRVDEIEAAAQAGYALAEAANEVSHLRVPLYFLHAYAYRPAGELAQSDTAIARIRQDTLDIPFEGSWHVAESWRAYMAGLSAMNRGDLPEAQRLCQESLVDAGSDHSGRPRKRFARLWLATVTAMAGRGADARREFEPTMHWDTDPDAVGWIGESSLAQAWMCAAEGAVSQAISILHDAATREADLGRHAWEVLLLQTATQFGDRTAAPRLTELTHLVQGPRAAVAAGHAGALAADDGNGLLVAATGYEQFGDRIAAADAAAQAAAVHHRNGKRGSALTAAATAQRLAAECGGADTPALRAGTLPLPITGRQREIIELAAQGLSNKQIADRLTMSVRSVEGHLFRASQRLGVNGRDGLIAMVHPPDASDRNDAGYDLPISPR